MSEQNEPELAIEVAPPEVGPEHISQTAVVLPASIWSRLTNYLIDAAVKIILIVIVTAVGGSAGETAAGIFALLAMILVFGYELIMESIWQRTVAKFITNTKVVDNFGNKPSFLRTLGRSAARLIPFEPFSLLVSKYPRGWHDSLSGTLVVRASLSESELKSINVEAIKKQESSSTARTLVIIIAVIIGTIVIIGILSSFIFASLATARARGQEAGVKSTMFLFKAQALIYQEKNNSYLGLCKSPEAEGLMSSILKSSQQFTSSDVICNDSEKDWALSVSKLASSYPGYFCTDNIARDVVETKIHIGNDTTCPVATPTENEKMIDIDGMDSKRN